VSYALHPAGQSSRHSKVVEEAVDTLLEPCAQVLDLCEYLPPSDNSPLTSSLLQSMQRAVVAVAAASDGPHVKRLLTAILEKSRSNDAEVRLNAVRCCHKIWIDLGVQVVTGLSEVVMFASELMEDEDPRVETAVRALIKTMEDCTGESLQDSLKN